LKQRKHIKCHRTTHYDDAAENDEFGSYDSIYNDDSRDYAHLLHPVQVLKKPPMTNTWVNDFGQHTDSIFSG